MTREIKFRAWDYNAKVMREVWEISYKAWDGDGDLNKIVVLGDDGTESLAWGELLQFTGLSDVNGKEIYEGDIVKDWMGDVGQVIWFNEYVSFAIDVDGSHSKLHSPSPHNQAYKPEILGNIFENSELVKND